MVWSWEWFRSGEFTYMDRYVMLGTHVWQNILKSSQLIWNVFYYYFNLEVLGTVIGTDTRVYLQF